MPIYEYRCKECGTKFEKLVFSSRTEEVECSNCGTKNTERLISAFAAGGDVRSSGSSGSSCGGGSGYFT